MDWSSWLTTRHTLPCSSLTQWYEALCAQTSHQPIAQALWGGRLAVSPGLAFLAGYQAALRALWPQAPQGLGALCVSEQRKLRPAELSCRWQQGALTGCKDFVTAADQARWLLVAAREEGAEAAPRLMLAHVQGQSAGVQVDNLPPLPICPDISHGRLTLTQATGVRLAGDGWDDYVKPFRTLEDLYVLAALAAWLTRGVPQDDPLLNRLWALLLGLTEVSRHDPKQAATHVLLNSLFEQFFSLQSELDKSLPAAALELWQRDKRLLDIGRSARQQRWARALELLSRD